MKCEEEVMDWMQRYVDHELGEEETAQLFDHIATCPDCAEKFQILQALSRELEELPAVTPKFSLVDSIMPQLDAIDQTRREQGSTLQEMKPVTTDSGPVPMTRSKRQPWWNKVGGRAALGVAAAAAVLGIVVVTYQPETIQNADELLHPSTVSQLDESAAPNASNGSGGANAAIGPDQEKKKKAPDQQDALEPPKANKEAETDKSAVKTPSPENTDKATKKDTIEDKKTSNKQDAKPSDDVEKSNSHDKQSTSGKSSDKQDSEKNTASKDSATATSELDKRSMMQSSTETRESDQGGFSVAGNDDSLKTSNKGMTSEAGGSGSVETDGNTPYSAYSSLDSSAKDSSMPKASTDATDSTQTASIQISSPDGRYEVVVEGKKLKVYKLADNGVDKTALEIRNLNGTWVKGNWSDDSQTFTYETEQDGTSSKYTYTVPQDSAK